MVLVCVCIYCVYALCVCVGADGAAVATQLPFICAPKPETAEFFSYFGWEDTRVYTLHENLKVFIQKFIIYLKIFLYKIKNIFKDMSSIFFTKEILKIKS